MVDQKDDPLERDPVEQPTDQIDNLRLSDVIRNNTNITNIQDNVFFMPSVPEPATAVLGALSIGMIGLRRRRRAA